MTMTYKEVLKQAEQMLQSKATSTKNNYMSVLTLFDNFPNRASIVAITNEWLAKGLAGSTIRTKHAGIRWLFKHFPRHFDPHDTQEALNYMSDIKVNTPKTSYSTPEQVDQLIESCDSRTALIIGLMYYHGLRVWDVDTLKLSNFRESDKGLLLEFIDEKTEKPHTYRVIDKVLPLFHRYVNGQRKDIMSTWKGTDKDAEYLFVGRAGHLVKRSIQRLVKRACCGCDFSALHCHSFRHGCATAYAKAGASAQTIQYALGQKSITSAMRYIHLNEDDLYEVSKAVF